MNNLLSSMLNSAPAASRFADEARASTARAQSAKAEMSGQFSQLLRGYDKPPESPKPAASTPPSAPPKPEGKTEMQRQEARSAAPKKSTDPQAKAAETKLADPATSASASATASASASSDSPAVDASEAVDGTRPDKKLAAEVAAPENAPVAPLPMPLASTGLMGLMGTANRQQGETAAAAGDTESDERKTSTSADIGTGRGAGTHTSGTTSLSRVAQAAAEDAKAKADDNSGAHSATDFAATLADAVQAQPAALRAAEAGPQAHLEAAALAGIAGAGASAATSHANLIPASASAGSPTRVDVASPLHTAAFAPEMAARLSVLAADGVQTAQLHLNPADMGPVAVQIVLEGQQARIEFQADQADTRAVLERSLPDLAAALRDSGLTLSGGGVFQQFAGQDSSGAQNRNEANGSARNGRAGSNSPADTVSALPPRAAGAARQTQGVVDLYA